MCSISFLSTLIVLSLFKFLQKYCLQYCKKKRKTLWDYWFWFLVVWSALVASGKKLQILWYRNQLNSHSQSELLKTLPTIKTVPDTHSGATLINSTNHTILVSKKIVDSKTVDSRNIESSLKLKNIWLKDLRPKHRKLKDRKIA